MTKSVKVNSRNLFWDWLLMLTNLWLVIGIYVDGWAHNHIVEEIETFFTPWHALFYSGFAVSALVVLLSCWKGFRSGKSWKHWAPEGYGLAVLGVGIFFLGGLGDMTWHTLLGIESGVDALLSPTHLLLAIGAILIVAAPWRAAYRTVGRPKSFFSWLPVLLSATMVFSLLAFMSQYSSPIAHPWAEIAQRPGGLSVEQTDFYGLSMGINGIILHAALMTGVALLLLRRWNLPFGAFTLYLGLSALAMSFMHDFYEYVYGALLAGLLIDSLLKFFSPEEDVAVRRCFAFLIPAIFFACYFLVVFWKGGTWWSIHFWTGAIILPGFTGLLLSYLERPPRAA